MANYDGRNQTGIGDRTTQTAKDRRLRPSTVTIAGPGEWDQ
jgi:hypothetical protein